MIFIERIEEGEKATIGRAKIGSFKFWTLEPKNDKNIKGKSRIKPGVYNAWVDQSEQLGKVIRLENKYNRTNILIHIGNYPDQTTGCILPGMSRAENKEAVWRSEEALKNIFKELEGRKELKVRIENRFKKNNSKGGKRMNVVNELEDAAGDILPGFSTKIINLLPEQLIKEIAVDGVASILNKINESEVVQAGAKGFGKSLAETIPGDEIEEELIEFLEYVIGGVEEKIEEKN